MLLQGELCLLKLVPKFIVRLQLLTISLIIWQVVCVGHIQIGKDLQAYGWNALQAVGCHGGLPAVSGEQTDPVHVHADFLSGRRGAKHPDDRDLLHCSAFQLRVADIEARQGLGQIVVYVHQAEGQGLAAICLLATAGGRHPSRARAVCQYKVCDAVIGANFALDCSNQSPCYALLCHAWVHILNRSHPSML